MKYESKETDPARDEWVRAAFDRWALVHERVRELEAELESCSRRQLDTSLLELELSSSRRWREILARRIRGFSGPSP
ncbi:hypothetical protein H8R02_29095 [Ramlibacter sp. GTP1]|uniref:Uncharacterized protein n=1 Tax=Ramlibacter albus TaxID=2079448 RepID=A0A923MFF0_9BURK|nr:hypothetical protein [Ramlibacter albus]